MKFQQAKRVFLFLLFLGIGFLHLGTVLKKKDPIQETQTDPVGYQDKLKEEEEGKKGPPAPALNLFPKEKFLVEDTAREAKEPASVGISQEGTVEKNKEESDLWLEEEKSGRVKPDEEADDTWEDLLSLDEGSEEKSERGTKDPLP